MEKGVIILFLLIILTGCNTNDFEEKNINKEIIEKEEVVTEIDDKKLDDNTDEINNNSEFLEDSYINDEEDVVNYFENIKETIKEKMNKDTWENTKDYIGSSLENIYGFCFENEELGGYRLDELSGDAKEKIMNIFLEIDTYIESKRPDYKIELKEKYDKILENAKDNITNIKDKINNIFDKNEEN